jgi:phage baseplate assembly protein W
MPADTSISSRRRSFLGSGWAFPVCLDAAGAVALVEGDEDVRQSIRIILGTNLGERIRMDFGSGIQAFVFEPISTTTLTLLRARVEEALVRWEPRIDVERVEASLPERTAGRVDVSIDYRVRETNTFYNLVYPFYLEEGEGSWR